MSATDELRTLAVRMDGLVPGAPDTLREAADEIDVLQAENDKLIVKLNAEHIVRQNVEAENAKLRELVNDLMPIVCDCCHERLCDMPREEHPSVECLFDCRMRELGIEVS